MYVQGVWITEEQVKACLARMQKPGSWRAITIEGAAEAAGVPRGVESMRLADRLIQRERRAGRITQIQRGVWAWAEHSKPGERHE